jgi:mediator of RNA polymerase II transcription subunit 17
MQGPSACVACPGNSNPDLFLTQLPHVMASASTTTNVALRPWPSTKKEKLEPVDIFNQVNQLAAERGHLRSVTEQKLQEEVDNGEDATEDVMQGVEKEGLPKTQSRDERLQELARAKAEMLAKLKYV